MKRMHDTSESPRPSLADLVRTYGGLVFSASAPLYAKGNARGALALDDLRLTVRPEHLMVHSGSVRPGDLFAGLPGLRVDGARFVPDAAARGASMVLLPADRSLARMRELVRSAGAAGRGSAAQAPLLWLHPRASAIVGDVAADIYGRPGERLSLGAVTGTNGKTSVCHLVSQLLGAAGLHPATLGTAGHTLRSAAGPLHLEATHTTPDSTEIQRLLARHLGGGGDCAVMEASSHALVQGRLAGLELRAAAFTNLTREHLDYHGTLERYLDAKARLWDAVEVGGQAVVFDGSPASGIMAQRAAERGLEIVRVALEGSHGNVAGAAHELMASDVRAHNGGASFRLDGLGLEGIEVHLPLRGAHNVENALVALALAHFLGPSAGPAGSPAVERLLPALSNLAAAPGRLEVVPLPVVRSADGKPFEVIVDYAHSPDALERVLGTLRAELAGDGARLICVFGCGGDRDRGKRTPMGRAAGLLSDVSIVTSDNPRSEAPEAIAEAILAGIDEVGGRRIVELDRARAIERALGMARSGDVVLIAGKGHENTQVIAGRSLPFDDRVVASEAFLKRRESHVDSPLHSVGESPS